jgi:hypothetical protein
LGEDDSQQKPERKDLVTLSLEGQSKIEPAHAIFYILLLYQGCHPFTHCVTSEVNLKWTDFFYQSKG